MLVAMPTPSLRVTILALLLLAPLLGRAQSHPPQTLPALAPGTLALPDGWAFHLGDNRAWASAALPAQPGQSGWEPIRTDASWSSQNHPGYTGPAWYRKSIRFSPCPAVQPLYLLIPRIDDSYELYWNGWPIGGFGKFPPRSMAAYVNSWYRPQVYSLPALSRDPDGSCAATIALRVYREPRMTVPIAFNMGGFRSPPIIGYPRDIDNLATAIQARHASSNTFASAENWILVFLLTLSLALWIRRRNQPVLVWMAALCFSSVLEWFIHEPPFLLGSFTVLAIAQVAWIYQNTAQIFLLYHILGLKRSPALTRACRIFATLNIATLSLYVVALVLEYALHHPHWVSNFGGAIDLVYYPIQLFPIVLAILGIRRSLAPSRLAVAIATVITQIVVQLVDFNEEIQRFIGYQPAGDLRSALFTIGGNSFDPNTIARTLFLITIVWAVARITIEAAARHSHLQLELQSARAVQQLLVPESLPATPGFHIQAAYRAAGELGGDFFQILPRPDQSVLLVIGDVSGKGIPASLTVSLLLGTLTTVADTTFSPSKILSALNQTLLLRSTPGFTTALVLSISPRGTVTAASAGHLSPYRDGREMELDPGLPLGLSPDATYPESIFQLVHGEQLTLLTDGVPEAMNPRHQLFGFPRAAQISTQSAESIASAAQSWGQSDDITVLTLLRAEAAHA